MLRWLRALVLAQMLFAMFNPPSACAEEGEFRLGVISVKPAGRINEYGPLATYVADRLKKFGIGKGKVVVARDVDKMVERIRKKEVEVIFESAFPTIELKGKAGIIPELLVWKKGGREYSTVFFVRKKSGIKKLKDLKGKTIVFEDPHSTSAFLIPKGELNRIGLAVLPAKRKGRRHAVSYMFAREETNEAFWVIKKKADAGVFSSDDWKELSPKVKKDLRVIHETKPVLRFIASFNSAVPAELRDAISAILVNMHQDREGKKILATAAGTKKIEKLSDQDYLSLMYVQELAGDIKE